MIQLLSSRVWDMTNIKKHTITITNQIISPELRLVKEPKWGYLLGRNGTPERLLVGLPASETTHDLGSTERYPCGKQQQLPLYLHSPPQVKPQTPCSHPLGSDSRKLHKGRARYGRPPFWEQRWAWAISGWYSFAGDWLSSLQA